jgi:hypothetical protein
MPPRHGGSGGVSSSRLSIGGKKARASDSAWVGARTRRDESARVGAFFRRVRYRRAEVSPIGVFAEVRSDDSTARSGLRSAFQSRSELESPPVPVVELAG